jgi:hypothetical protein
MTKQFDITAEYVRSILDYNPQTGVFVWRPRAPDDFKDKGGKYTKERSCKIFNKRFAGKQAGVSLNKRIDPYSKININNRQYLAHVIAWFYVTGDFPKVDIDHKDNNPLNNSFQNLRLSSRTENNANAKKRLDNTTGFKGVCFNKNAKKFSSKIQFERKQINLGYFNSAEEAYKAYCEAAKKLFGEFARFE